MDSMKQRLMTTSGDAVIDLLIKEAIARKISDIHLHPQKQGARVQWRSLGILEDIGSISLQNYEMVARKLKFDAKLKLNQERLPQDGQLTVKADDDGRIVNIRVASLPTRFGEAYTLRFLDPARGIVPLEQLGFPPEYEKELRRIVGLPNGLILVTGPTGSGKTTTLYALLDTLKESHRNIITLEDPVEYELEHITQSQIDTEHGYTFANGLRAVLRHDPDIILLGEIRDGETATTAIDASLTGHLVLATLHTNAAIEAIPRLLSMGANRTTLAPALRAIVAQRLVRTVSPPFRADHTQHKHADNFYDGQRVLSELLTITPDIESLILKQASSADILHAATAKGFTTMRQRGAQLIQSGETTIEEVARVTADL